MLKLATKFRPGREEFEQARQAGFPAAEVWLDAGVLAGWREVAALAAGFPLDYALHFPNRLEQPAATLEQTASLYRAVDAHALVIHQPHIDRHGAALLALAPDLRLAVENHTLDRAGFWRWAETNPGLALDVEHLWMHTLPGAALGEVLACVAELLRRHGDKLHHVHLPGYLPGQPEHRPMYCSRDLVFGVFDLLQGAGFARLVVSEVAQEYQKANDLRMDVLLFDTWRKGRSRVT